MKNYIAILAISLAIVSCSSDEDVTPAVKTSDESNLLGTWGVVSYQLGESGTVYSAPFTCDEMLYTKDPAYPGMDYLEWQSTFVDSKTHTFGSTSYISSEDCTSGDHSIKYTAEYNSGGVKGKVVVANEPNNIKWSFMIKSVTDKKAVLQFSEGILITVERK